MSPAPALQSLPPAALAALRKPDLDALAQYLDGNRLETQRREFAQG